jgi:predicted nucleic acid-binding protein
MSEQQVKRILTLDSNAFISALKSDEPYSRKCAQIIELVPNRFLLAEPSVVYQEVCGTLARRAGSSAAQAAREQLDRMIDSKLLSTCDKDFCLASYPLCSQFKIYAIDALYLWTAISTRSTFVSLDREDLTEKVESNPQLEIEVYHVSDFPL